MNEGFMEETIEVARSNIDQLGPYLENPWDIFKLHVHYALGGEAGCFGHASGHED